MATDLPLYEPIPRKGTRVVLIDMDSQANRSKVLLRDDPTLVKSQTVFATIVERCPLQVHSSQSYR